MTKARGMKTTHEKVQIKKNMFYAKCLCRESTRFEILPLSFNACRYERHVYRPRLDALMVYYKSPLFLSNTTFSSPPTTSTPPMTSVCLSFNDGPFSTSCAPVLSALGASAFCVLRATLASRFALYCASRSSKLGIGGLSAAGGPQGAMISVTTWRICLLAGCRAAIRTTSPVRRDEFGSETRWDW